MTSRFAPEALEARVLLSAATLQTYVERMGYDQPMLAVEVASLAFPEQLVGFGRAVALIGDVNNDGVPDFVISTRGLQAAAGQAMVPGALVLFSGSDGSELGRVIGDQPDIGRQLMGIGDVNNDGVPDFVAVSRSWTQTGQSEASGRVAVYSGSDLALLWEVIGSPGEKFGWDSAIVPDSNGDGIDDLAVGAPFAENERGEVRLLNGADGTQLSRFQGVEGERAHMGTLVEAVTVEGEFYLIAGGVNSSRDPSFPSDPELDSVQYLRVDSSGILIRDSGYRHFFGEFRDIYYTAGIDLNFGKSWIDGDTTFGRVYWDPSRVMDVLSPGLEPVDSLIAIGDLNNNGNIEYLMFGRGGIGSTLYGVRADGNPTVRLQHWLSPRKGSLEDTGYRAELGQPGAFELDWTSAVVIGDYNADGFNDVLAVNERGFKIIHGLHAVPPGQDINRFFVSSNQPQQETTFISADGNAGLWIPDHFWNQRIVFRNNSIVPAEEVLAPTLMRILAADANGMFIGTARAGSGFEEGILLVEQLDGTVVPFTSLVTQVIGGTLLGLNFSNPVPQANGGLIVQGESLSAPATTVWQFASGVLTKLWDGRLIDATDNGWAIGTLLGTGDEFEGVTIVRGPAGVTHTYREITQPGAVNRSGVAVGFNSATNLVYMRDGVLDIATTTPFQLYTALALGGIYPIYNPVPFILDLGDDDLVLISISDAVSTNAMSYFVYSDQAGMRPLHQVLDSIKYDRFFESPDFVGMPRSIAQDGITTLLGIIQLDASQMTAFRTSIDGQVSIVHTPNGLYVTGFDQIGSRIQLIRNENGELVGQSQIADDPASQAPNSIITWYDPERGMTGVAMTIVAQEFGGIGTKTDFIRRGFIFYVDALGFPAGVREVDANFGENFTSPEQWTAMVDPSGSSHVAWLTSDGVLRYWPQRLNALQQFFSQLAVGSSTVATNIDFQDNTMVSYATAWGGLNIAGINSDGEVVVAWTAPGLEGWRTNNLSQIAGAPKLVGNISAFVTPWNAIHIVGTDEQGNMQILWWAPALGQGNWQTSNLTSIVGAVPGSVGDSIQAGSLTAYVTPWNGLNIAARTTAGELVAYWWTPSTQQWVADRYFDPANGPVPTNLPVGMLSSTVSPGGTMSIAGVNSQGDITRLWWAPESPIWKVENLSALGRGESA